MFHIYTFIVARSILFTSTFQTQKYFVRLYVNETKLCNIGPKIGPLIICMVFKSKVKNPQIVICRS